MQQIVPEEQLSDQQMINVIQYQNQMTQTNPNIQTFRTNQINVYKSLRNRSVFKLAFSLLELFLYFLALCLLPKPCANTTLSEFFILAIIVNTIEAFRILYLLLIIYNDLIEVYQSEGENRLPYPEFSFANTKYLIDAISDYHSSYKFIKYLMIVLNIVVFMFGQVQIYRNLYGECEIGEPEFNFTWGVALTFLILKYITIGIPTLIVVIYLLVLPFAYCINLSNLQKRNTGASPENLNKLKIEMVGQERISEDNECVICLQEFVGGEEFVRLGCHEFHVFHKACISDWLKARSECPKCRQAVRFN